MAGSDGAVTGLLRRERAIIVAALVLVTALSWLYLWRFSLQMASMPASMQGMDMMPAMAPQLAPWTPAHVLTMFAMWSVMMVGMMTPSVAPMVLIYAQVSRQAATLGKHFASAGWFLGGYLVAWTAFALAATSAQWALERVALLDPNMASTSRYFGAAVLIAVGVYQWTPLKETCLAQCRAPLAFVQRHGGFKPGISGSLRLGALHGLYCIGCCAALMALLFVGGVMNFLWIAAIAIFVLVEKIVPGARYVTRLVGILAIAAGVWMLVAA